MGPTAFVCAVGMETGFEIYCMRYPMAVHLSWSAGVWDGMGWITLIGVDSLDVDG